MNASRSLDFERGRANMKKRVVGFAVCLGFSVVALGGAAAGAAPAINCLGVGNPAQTARLEGAVGPNRFQTPAQLAQSLGQPSAGAAIQTYCVTPAGR
jgi:hypothetical protein